MKFRVLVLSGGSLCGIISMQVLKKIEELAGEPIHQFFNLIIGSSTGAIEGAVLASGGSPSEIEDMYFKHGKHIFTRRYPWWRIDKLITSPWYDRARVLTPLDNILESHGVKNMKDCKTNFVAMTVNVTTGENIRMTSYGEYSEDSISTCVAKSFAAVAYFGHFVDMSRRMVCEDGGEGIANIPVSYGLLESLRLTKPGDEIEIYAVGAGFNQDNPTFEEAVKQNNIEAAWESYLAEGETLARVQARVEQVKLFKELAELNRGVSFRYFDIKIPKNANTLTGWKYMNYYRDIGNQIEVDLI